MGDPRAPIDQRWILDLAEKLARVADQLPESSLMRKASMERAEHYVDLVAIPPGFSPNES